MRETRRGIGAAANTKGDAVQALTDEQRWIPVSERLPDFDVPVWLRCDGDYILQGLRTDDADGWLWANCYGGAHFSTAGKWEAGAEVDDDYQPTHWMPLPDPPRAILAAAGATEKDAKSLGVPASPSGSTLQPPSSASASIPNADASGQ